MFLSHWLRQSKGASSHRQTPLGLESLGERINPSYSYGPWSDWIDFVSPAATTHLYVLAPESTTVNGSASITVVALDASDHRVTDYTGTVSFSSTDPKATLPADYTFTASDRGIHVFTETPATTGKQTVTVTDTSNATIDGSASLNVTSTDTTSVTPASFDVITQPSATAGQPTRVAVYAVDANGKPLRDYTGTVAITSTDADATLPADYTFTKADHGVHVFDVTFATADTEQVIATDTSNSATGSATVTVNAAPVATHFAFVVSPYATTGSTTEVSVVALDANNRIVRGYTGTVTFSSSDTGATLPADYTFTADDQGSHVFDVTFATAGKETLTATDTTTKGVTGTATINVHAAPVVTSLGVIGAGTAYNGSTTYIAVVALDANGRPDRDYTGTVTFTSSDSSTTLPADYTFTAADQGYHVFQITPNADGKTTITATDTTTGTIMGSVTINVIDAPVATHLAIFTLPQETTGVSSYFAVVALDANNQPVPTYTGTVHFTSTDSAATLPSDYTFTAEDNGVHVFQTTPSATGTETLTATDTADATITGSQTVTVSAPTKGGGWFFPL